MIKLNEVADIIPGNHFTKETLNKYISNEPSNTGFLQIVDLKDLRSPVTKFLSQNFTKPRILMPYDILIPKLRTMVDYVLFDDSTFNFLNEVNPTILNYTVAESMFIVRPKLDLINPYLLMAFFNSTKGFKIIDNTRTNNTAPSLTIGTFKNINIPDIVFSQNNVEDIKKRHIQNNNALKLLYKNSIIQKNYFAE